MIEVWSCGGGTQSCAIAALIVQGKLPKPDISIISDTGYETQATWDYFTSVLRPALLLVGVELRKISGEQYGRFWQKSFVSDKQAEPMIPVYSTQTGTPIKLPNHCTQMWKIEVCNRYLSSLKVTKSKRRMWIGFSFDEQRRWAKWLDHDDYKKGLMYFPLVDLHLRRRDAIRLVEEMGWPTPPRSACWMCPNHSDSEWRRLKSERPEEFAMAVEYELGIQQRDPDAWLHKSCKPLGQVDFSQPEDLFNRPCDSGMCFI